ILITYFPLFKPAFCLTECFYLHWFSSRSDENSSSEKDDDHEREVYDFREPFLFSDMVLLVENEKLHCHRAILSLYSPVFKAMFQSRFEVTSLSACVRVSLLLSSLVLNCDLNIIRSNEYFFYNLYLQSFPSVGLLIPCAT
ncbi:unnamed protein product, partial [Rodentolepis nana]|uniref:BTB domain-containing protein n=1 Tax=Rodentolepis nana TaxID=102285 RepID=A0A0R3TS13_RODNA